MAVQPLPNNQKLGNALALAYAAVGLLGFTVTGAVDFDGTEGGKLSASSPSTSSTTACW